jgi:3-carboxy-cis,cis-muconate cycloisomerase
MVAGLEVDAARMRANLDMTLGMIVSEAVMMGLGPHLGRQCAHDLVYDICRKVAATARRWSICWPRTPISRGT